MASMDLHWKTARMRQWIDLGRNEGLTLIELAKRAGVHPRTMGRWNKRLREQESERLSAGTGAMAREPRRPPDVESAVLPEESFVDLAESDPSPAGRIEILLTRDRRVVIDGAVDVKSLVRVITAVEQC